MIECWVSVVHIVRTVIYWISIALAIHSLDGFL